MVGQRPEASDLKPHHKLTSPRIGVSRAIGATVPYAWIGGSAGAGDPEPRLNSPSNLLVLGARVVHTGWNERRSRTQRP